MKKTSCLLFALVLLLAGCFGVSKDVAYDDAEEVLMRELQTEGVTGVEIASQEATSIMEQGEDHYLVQGQMETGYGPGEYQVDLEYDSDGYWYEIHWVIY
ncbi:hypothetical protein HUG15_19560 [Salicibibacter cibarius]|uniref:Uncharacterized protein n=1 Tax=Salicibibacter cibarius TaxID=2743000 RepID=A0A7T6Z638_9BACI|nr:hypothetical protein [Salicibibacter cibarius]QQK77560.1 hypothetical protein HUG15_19560 [Salicibibacter cibarius]